MKKIVCLFVSLFVSTAQATIIDPDDFASGTDISNAFSGVTLTTVFGNDINNASSTGSVYSLANSSASTGSNAFAQSSSNSSWGIGSFEYLLVEFDTLVDFVALDFFTNDSSDSNAELVAFDSFGTEILRTSFLSEITTFETLSVTSATPQIASVRAYWDEVNRSENGGLDRLEYTVSAVPEPSAFALLALGLVGVGYSRKNKAA